MKLGDSLFNDITVNFCENGNGPPGPTNGSEFLDKLMTIHFSRRTLLDAVP
jgi:hypothetical protein